MSTIILRIGAKIIVALSLAFAAYIYFKGHQTPGGGFVGGLVAAVALVIHRMSFGGQSLRKLLPVSEKTLIAIGLLLALGTGLGALVMGLPFLTSNHGYITLPGMYNAVAKGETMLAEQATFEWATVMIFDLGVVLVVAGVVVGMIDALSKELNA